MFASCGGDGDEVIYDPVWAKFVSATPAEPGGEVAANGTITVTFDKPPIDVKVSAGTVTVTGKTATIIGPFTPGPLGLTINWAGGTRTLSYTVTAPCCAPPHIVGGTVEDGDTDVDPETINSDGKIVILFSEDIFGNIFLQTEGGDNVGWLGKIEGNKGTLELVKGRELVNETVYVIDCKISDAKGNAIDFEITFVTRGKA